MHRLETLLAEKGLLISKKLKQSRQPITETTTVTT